MGAAVVQGVVASLHVEYPDAEAINFNDLSLTRSELINPTNDVPDLCRTLTQRAAQVWTDSRGIDPLPAQTLRYGQDLIVRNGFVTTVGSPP